MFELLIGLVPGHHFYFSHIFVPLFIFSITMLPHFQKTGDISTRSEIML